MSNKESLVQAFQRFFDVKYAKTSLQKEQVYQIRYRVYCEEFGYEPKENFPDKQEVDEFDEHSLHALIIHKGTQRPAGCVRLVPAIDNGRVSGLPLEKYCAASLDMVFINGLQIERRSMCEISRLAVDAAFRRREGESDTRFGGIDAIDCSHQERRTFSLISVAAFLATTALAELSGRNNAFAMMEPFLPRLIKKAGIEFRRVGEDIDYHGTRAPYFSTSGSVVKNMSADLRELYDSIYQSIENDYRSSLRTQ